MAYFSNGSAGELLDNQCSECKLGEDPCPIAMAQMMCNYDAVGNKVATRILNILVDNKTGCQLFIDNKELMQIDYSDEKIIAQRYGELIIQDRKKYFEVRHENR